MGVIGLSLPFLGGRAQDPAVLLQVSKLAHKIISCISFYDVSRVGHSVTDDGPCGHGSICVCGVALAVLFACRLATLLIELYSAQWPTRLGVILLPPRTLMRIRESGVFGSLPPSLAVLCSTCT